LHHLFPTTLHDFREKSDGESFGCGERTRSVCQLADKGLVSGDLGQEGEGADVGCEANIDLLYEGEILLSRIHVCGATYLDAENRVLGSVANVARADEVNAEPDDVAVQCSNNRKGRALRGANGMLEGLQHLSSGEGRPGSVHAVVGCSIGPKGRGIMD
jgi:hypothetical protein